MMCAFSEDSDQPGNPPSLIRVFAVCDQCVAEDPMFLHADSEDPNQTVDGWQGYLSLRRAHRSFCWFYHETAHFLHL